MENTDARRRRGLQFSCVLCVSLGNIMKLTFRSASINLALNDTNCFHVTVICSRESTIWDLWAINEPSPDRDFADPGK